MKPAVSPTFVEEGRVPSVSKPDSAPAATSPPPETGQALALIIEDDQDTSRFIAATLSPEYKVATAFDGREGLQKARELQPDIILSDLMMPRMSGEQFLYELRRQPEFDDVPLVLLTAKADDELRLKLLRQGAQDYLLKPFSPEELRARVAIFVSMRKASQVLKEELTSQSRDLVVLTKEAVERKKQLEKALLAQKQAEEQLQKLNGELEVRVAERTARLQAANEELEMFTSTVVHDLRAPLRAMQGMTQILKEDYADKLDSTAQDYANRIIESAQRMDALVMDLLAYTRISRGPIDVHAISLMQAITEARAALAADIQEHKAEIIVEGQAGTVMASRAFLQHALTNLLANAIKFVSSQVKPRVHIRLEETPTHVRIWVEDNGIGIAPEHHQRVFRIFERLHNEYPGTGIGLAIVERAITRMGGKVGLESALSQGSKFWIQLAKPEGDKIVG